MKVLIDALSARGGGGITYMRYMPAALVRQAANIKFTVLLSRRYQSELAQNLPEQVSIIDANLSSSLPRRWWYLQSVLPRLLKQGQFDLLFAVAESSYWWLLPCPMVILARNASIYADPASFGRQWLRLLFHRMVRQPLVMPSLWRAKRVVCVSETFRREVCKKTGLPESKTQVVYHGLSPLFREASECEDNGLEKPVWEYPFILAVSTINSHKNYETLIRAFAKVVQLPEWSAYHLLVAGDIGDRNTYKMLLGLVDTLNLERQIHFLGGVDHSRLISYYRTADAFVLPSRLETFGHPLVEAMAAGTPVIASDLPVCREICQDAALYFEPEDNALLADHMQDVLRDRGLRQELVRRGAERSQVFSWERSARRMVEIFQQVTETGK